VFCRYYQVYDVFYLAIAMFAKYVYFSCSAHVLQVLVLARKLNWQL